MDRLAVERDDDAATLILVEIMRALRDEGEPSDPPTPPAGPRLAP